MRLSDCGTVRPKERGRLHRRGVTMIAVLLLVSIVCIIPAAAGNDTGTEGGTILSINEAEDAKNNQDSQVAVHALYLGETDTYNIWVNNIQVTENTLTIPCGSGTAVYDPAAATLTLTNAEITTGCEIDYLYSGIVSFEDDLTIVLVGENTITETGGEGISTYQTDPVTYEPIPHNLTVTGNGNLTIVESTPWYGYGIYCTGMLSLNGINIDITSSASGLWAGKDMHLTDSEIKILLSSTFNGLVTNTGTITVDNSMIQIDDSENGVLLGRPTDPGHFVLNSGNVTLNDCAIGILGMTADSTITVNSGSLYITVTDVAVVNVSDANIHIADNLQVTGSPDSTTYSIARPKYALTVVNGIGSGSYAAGVPVSVNTTLPSGYAFTGWISDNGGTFANASAVNTTFTMPGNIVNITANMEALLVTSITITSPTEGTQYDISDAATAAARVYDQNGNEMSGILLDWSSSNPSILSVSGSSITANNAGNVVLTAVNGSVSANVNLTVLPAPVKPDLPEVDAEKNDDGSTTIDTTGKPGIEIKDADEEIIISDTNASVIVQYDDMTNVGGIVTGNISGITAVYQQMTAIPDIEAAGLANANVGLIIEITLKNVTTQLPAFLPAINLTDKEKIKENNNAVGIMLQARTPESFTTNVSSVTLTFDNVSKAWTDTYGGTQNIRVLHLADSGIISYLTGGTWAGPVNGAYTLKIDSPYGFSSYSLVGIPQTPVPPTPEVQDNGGTDDGAELLASVGAGPTSSAAPTVKPTGSVTVTPTAALTASPTGTAIPTTAVPTETATSRPSTTEAPVPLLGGLLGLAAGGLLLYQRR